MTLNWGQFKNYIENCTNVFIHFVEFEEFISLEAANGPFVVSCAINKSAEAEDVLDFETNWKSKCNKPYNLAVDGDGAQVVNPKLAGDGTKYQATSINFKTADLNSLRTYDWNFQPLDIAEIKCFDHEGNECQEGGESQAVVTLITVNKGKTFYIQGFSIKQKEQPTQSMILSAAMAPHIPKQYGGCVEVIQGCDLSMAAFGNHEEDWVGDSASEVKYDQQFQSHVMALKILHPAGMQHAIQCEVIWYV